MISNITLRSKAGYIEIEVDGKRMYKRVDTGEIFLPEDLPQGTIIGQELEDVWNELAAAYTEGVNSI